MLHAFMQIVHLEPDEEAEIVTAIQTSAGLGATYLVLLMLATIIATFGLIGNSTATVIGAMIVAPLMGPILGIALGLVRGHLDDFRRALLAEGVGVALCLGTSGLLSVLTGAGLDFSQSEIIGRTHPTLIDLAIGFSAGLAGAYCTVNRKVGGSIAGVAIAVSLVPPLCVSGLCLGQGLWAPSLGAFVLFAANFLTIQLAATIVFALSGLGHWENFRQQKGLFRAFLMNLALLLLTGLFLADQLQKLLEERRADKVSRRVIEAQFARLPGAALDALDARLDGNKLRLEVRARAPEEIGVKFAAELERELEDQLSYDVELRIGTALATYVTPAGRIFAPVSPLPDPAAQLLADSRWAVAQGLSHFPGVELTNLSQRQVTSDGQSLFLSVRSPYVFDSRQVARLQELCRDYLARRQPEHRQLSLTVRTSLSQDYTAQGLQEVFVPGDESRLESERRIRAWLESAVARQPQLLLQELQVSLQETEAGAFTTVRARVLSPRPLESGTLAAWRKELQTLLEVPVELSIRVDLGYLVELQGEAAGTARGSLAF